MTATGTPIAQMYVLCSLPTRPDAKAASDCCGQLAVGAVRDESGAYLYRCATHRYLVTIFGGPGKNQTIRGSYVTVIPGGRV